ncbi:Macrolide-specific efflux protein MacA [Enhygromyxa salina]|uniref:Macrolide-specific efflux protein MacA n=1 Tax=Enhygromyxa salina TaxID=215803 RepID=A0A0C2D3T6_9BACT|nr:efflux RND transporter periplasmic adaptor subunit [Enhygromyxa salina]KIG16390.1 Macrolide-specific efflux protein MacA [Enhygromyxa salina]
MKNRYVPSGLLCMTLLFGCDAEPAAEPTEAPSAVVEVRTLEVAPADWSETILVYGAVESIEEVSLSATLGATALSVHFDVGDKVEVGTLLVEFDPAGRRTQLKQSLADLNAAKAAAADARVDLDEARSLMRAGAMAGTDVDAAERALRRAQESYENARSGYSLARTDVNDTKVASPVSGTVSERFVDPGETVSLGASLATIVVTDALRVRAYVSERRVNQVRVGDRAMVEVSGVPGKSFEARIEQVGLAADPQTGNFEVRVAINAVDPLLRPGMTARVYIQTLPETDVIVVPVRAMVERDRRRLLFVEREGVAHEIEPSVGLGNDQFLPVYDGLEIGDQVIVDGLEYVLAGTRVHATATQDKVLADSATAPPAEGDPGPAQPSEAAAPAKDVEL